MARLKDLHHVGPFFSTDAGGYPNSAYGSLGQTDGVPASTNIPGLEDFLGTISTMQVPQLGVYTPWGKLVQAPTVLGWDIERLSAAPDTNIIAFEYSQVAQLLTSLGFGQPSFLALLSSTPLSPESVKSALLGTPYKLFDDGVAVFNQADPTGIPSMGFLYWAVLRDPGDTSGAAGSVMTAAESIGALLVFAQQVPVEQSTLRSFPNVDVSLAAKGQFPAYFGSALPPLPDTATAPYQSPMQTTAVVDPTTVQPPQTAPVKRASLAGPILFGLVAAGVGVALTSRRKGARR